MMHLFRQQLLTYFSILFLLICIVYCSRANAEEHHANKNSHSHDQSLDANRLQLLKEILYRRSLYDPAFGSWSNNFEKKRELFDPAYNDWASSFKRSDE